jgi:hypothetical protein
MLHIGPESGFEEMPTKSISSKVFRKTDKIYKINKRNSYERALSDWQTINTELAEFLQHIPHSEIGMCVHDGEQYTCISQEIIPGKELSLHSPDEIHQIFKVDQNRLFVKKLISYFFEAIQSKKLYPDIVGNPTDPHLFNSINLIVNERGLVILCDVGLGPHENTMLVHGDSFFESENVKLYLKRISDSLKDLNLEL